MLSRIGLFLVIALVCAGLGCSSSPGSFAGVASRIEALGPFPVNVVGSYFISRDGRHVAIVFKQGDGVALSVDGVAGQTVYDQISEVVFSANGKRVAYTAGKGGKQFAVIDGRPGPNYDKISCLEFGDEGKRVAYRAIAGQEEVAVVDGRVWPEKHIDAGPCFSPGGKHVAFVARRPGEERSREVMLLDGHVSREYLDIWGLGQVFSPVDNEIAYVGERDEETWSLVIGDREIARCNGEPWPPAFSADGRHVAYPF